MKEKGKELVLSGSGLDAHHVNDKVPKLETVSDSDQAGSPSSSATIMHENPEFLLEARPFVAASMNDMVEKKQYLFVSVVKARDLPVMDPYVEVKLGDYKGVIKHLENNPNPVWNQFFAIPKERLQTASLQVSVKNKDINKDDFMGIVPFDLSGVPLLVLRHGQLAPQWYRLGDRYGSKTKGEIMLAVWMGTQADKFLPEARDSDVHDVSDANLSYNRSMVYFSPPLYYIRVQVIEAQDLALSDEDRASETVVKVLIGNQARFTRHPIMHARNPIWNEELMFVASEPFDDHIVVSVEKNITPVKSEVLGRLIIPVRDIPHRSGTIQPPKCCWYNLHNPLSLAGEESVKEKFSSKIHLRVFVDAGYHVLDESPHFSSDLQPSSKHLRKGSIGILELEIRNARKLLAVESNDGRTTNPYCVAKYGNKWVRTRTQFDNVSPQWFEQYTWEVYDPCTVITIGVFNNCHINGSKEDTRDQKIGKVRIRLSTLETDRDDTDYYPLLVLQASGLKKLGEIQLKVRFTCTSWANMLVQYGKPLLPKMHHVQPITVRNLDWLRHQAMQIVASRLARAEPPLRKEVVEYMLDVDYHMWSLRRSKANFHRIMSFLSVFSSVCRWLDDIRTWKNPITTCLVHVWFFILVSNPEIILPTIFLYLFAIGLWNYRFRTRHPPHIDARLSQAHYVNQDELDEEFDSFPTSRPKDIVRMRYDRLRSVAGRVQTVVGDLATQGERALSIVSWRDPRATSIFIGFALVSAVSVYFISFQGVGILVCLFLLRHPRFRSKMPSVPANFFKRLPCKLDMLF